MSMYQFAIKVMPPVEITDTILTDTDIAETDYSEYNAGTTYDAGDRVIVAADHLIYESAQGSNTGNTPADSPTWWVEVSATNRWKAFDAYNSTRTITDGGSQPTIMYELTPAVAISAIGVLDIVNATTLTINMTDPTYGEVYDEEIDLSALPATSDWWAWFFGTKYAPTQYIATDLPAYPAAVLTITLEGTTSLGVGKIIIGPQQEFGVGVRYGARVGIQDYSRKETNDFGDVELIQRAYAKRASVDFRITSLELDQLEAFLAAIRTTPCLWVLSSKYEALQIFGIYKSFDILIDYFQFSDCSLEIEGLT